MWKTLTTPVFERRFKHYEKKKKNELFAVTNNLDRLVNSLESGKQPNPSIFGFLRSEGSNILRISEAGPGPRVAATRLYVYPDAEKDELHLLTIGDKNTQSEDILYCKSYVKELRADPSLGGTRSNGHNTEEGDEADRS